MVQEYGEPDAFGHRKKMSVGGSVERRDQEDDPSEETIISDLTYDLRGGEPDFVDKMVATTFGNMALDALAEGKSGFMTAIVKGCFTLSDIPDPKLGPRKVDIAEACTTPSATGRSTPASSACPIFLTKA